jgi:ribonuclease J
MPLIKKKKKFYYNKNSNNSNSGMPMMVGNSNLNSPKEQVNNSQINNSQKEQVNTQVNNSQKEQVNKQQPQNNKPRPFIKKAVANSNRANLPIIEKEIIINNEISTNEIKKPKNKQNFKKGKGGTPLKVLFLGGVGEIGKNMTALEYGNDIIIIDAGLSFPNEEMLGIDLVIPDISYLVNNKEKIRGVVITHGHEDHIGGLPYLLKEIKMPVYGTKLALALADNKLREHRINDAKMNVTKAGDVIKLGCFSIEFIRVTHSISGAVAFAITTPLGVVFHSGDYKIDLTPINGETMDLPRIAEIGQNGVLLMMSDSTNVERPGYTMSESVVGDTLNNIFAENEDRRLIIATFASNVHRLQQIIELAGKYKRKVALSGRSMNNVVEAASRIGELNIAKDSIIDIDKIKNLHDRELVIISTGSQGEPMSALTRMASGEFNKVKVGENDTIIISASPIPGNEKMVYRVINNLYRKGAKVIYESLEKIHVSGHACQEEIKLLHSLVKPKFFIPVHGEYRHLKIHAMLANEMGLRLENILIADIGNCVEITKNSMKFGDSFTAGARLVDGVDTLDGDENVVLRDRRHLAEDGIFVVVVGISTESGTIVSGPDIVNKGFIWGDENVLNSEVKTVIINALSQVDLKKDSNSIEAKATIKRAMRNYLYKKVKKNPMILPVIMEI